MYYVFGLCFLALTSAAVIQKATEFIGQPSLSLANSEFSLKLYRELAKLAPGNVVFSPYSLSTALSMMLEGASGTTALETLTALGYSNLPRLLRQSEHRNIVNSLKNGQGYNLEIANSLWLEEKFSVLPTFKKTVSEVFDAEEAGFNTGTGHNIINRWVERKTNGKITNLLEKLPWDTVMLLINAIYFKGTWEVAFNASDNTQDIFRSPEQRPSTANQATFMKLDSKFRYIESEPLKSQILQMPYKGGEMHMIVILPKENVPLSEVENSLSAQTLIGEIKAARPRLVHLTLPKFKIEKSFNLNEPLKQLGIREVFSDRADFSALNPREKIAVSKVIQKALIEVNEEGSEAAAATAIIFATRSSFSYNYPVNFVANRPFLFALYHSPTNTILFFGRVMKP